MLAVDTESDIQESHTWLVQSLHGDDRSVYLLSAVNAHFASHSKNVCALGAELRILEARAMKGLELAKKKKIIRNEKKYLGAIARGQEDINLGATQVEFIQVWK